MVPYSYLNPHCYVVTPAEDATTAFQFFQRHFETNSNCMLNRPLLAQSAPHSCSQSRALNSTVRYGISVPASLEPCNESLVIATAQDLYLWCCAYGTVPCDRQQFEVNKLRRPALSPNILYKESSHRVVSHSISHIHTKQHTKRYYLPTRIFYSSSVFHQE